MSLQSIIMSYVYTGTLCNGEDINSENVKESFLKRKSSKIKSTNVLEAHRSTGGPLVKSSKESSDNERNKYFQALDENWK